MNKPQAPKAQRPPQVKPRMMKPKMTTANMPNYKTSIPYNTLVQAPGVSNNKRIIARPINSPHLHQAKLSDTGMAFLKCAFAPPDFANSNVRGVPDEFEGRSLVKKHRLIAPIVFGASLDTYIILAPIPGVAYCIATVAPGTPIIAATIFTAVTYSDFDQLFGGGNGINAANVVTKYRFVSNHFELIPTVNQTNWTGNVQTWKLPLSVQVRSTIGLTNANNLYAISGLQGCNSTQSDQYTGPFNLGVYTAAYNAGANFPFTQVLENQQNIPATAGSAGDFGQIVSTGANCIPGMDNQFDSLVIKISGVGTNVFDSAILKTWACVEYQVLPNSSLYEYTSVSPCDEFAIKVYRQIINELPVGVSFVDNENFWRRVLEIIRRVSGTMSIIPGPYGMAAGGMNSIATALETILY